MYPVNIPDAPCTTNAMATGYEDGAEPQMPHCPICGSDCNTIYRGRYNKIIGCDMCLVTQDAWDVPECFVNGKYY